MALANPSPSLPSPPERSFTGRRLSDGPHHGVKKKTRVPLSCTFCRVRKLKCDRQSPCVNCAKRNQPAGCIYGSNGARGDEDGRPSSGTVDQMQGRIDKLERLVLTLVGSSSAETSKVADASHSSPTSSQPYTPKSLDGLLDADAVAGGDPDEVTKSFGHLQVNDDRSSYIGDSHWATILQELSEVKNLLNDKQYEDALRADHSKQGLQIAGPAFFLGASSVPDIEELVTRLPNRTEVDKLVDRYFDDYDPGLYILHMPAWRRRYATFWEQPDSTADVPFLAQVYSICCLAMQSYSKDPEEPAEYRARTHSLAEMYRRLTQQCLQLVDYSKLEQTTVETFILHMHAEYQRNGEVNVGMWVLSRTTIGLAMRIGLHRDGTNFPGMTPYQCETRRRQWAHLRMVDVIWSFFSGMPMMIKAADTDTRLPTNLKDEDFDIDTVVLPPERPRSELTDISYLIMKTGTASVFGRIIETVTGTGTIHYEDVVKLNTEAHETYSSMFPMLQMTVGNSDSADSAGIFAMKLSLNVQYNKALCVLHRKYLVASRINPRYRLSRQVCIDAALTLLRNQQLAKAESGIDGRVYRLQTHFSAYMNHDFILAATLIALDLLQSAQRIAKGHPSDDVDIWGRDRQAEQLEALEKARSIWDGLGGRYMEASRAYSIIGVMIDKVQRLRGGAMDPTRPTPALTPDTHLLRNPLDQTSQAHASTNSALGLARLMDDPALALGHFAPTSDLNAMENGTGVDFTTGMDWSSWDGYMQNAGLDLDFSKISPPNDLDINNGLPFDFDMRAM